MIDIRKQVDIKSTCCSNLFNFVRYVAAEIFLLYSSQEKKDYDFFVAVFLIVGFLAVDFVLRVLILFCSLASAASIFSILV